jgi:hypothetical protein
MARVARRLGPVEAQHLIALQAPVIRKGRVHAVPVALAFAARTDILVVAGHAVLLARRTPARVKKAAPGARHADVVGDIQIIVVAHEHAADQTDWLRGTTRCTVVTAVVCDIRPQAAPTPGRMLRAAQAARHCLAGRCRHLSVELKVFTQDTHRHFDGVYLGG